MEKVTGGERSEGRSLVENLRAFNRKERFFLVGWALGNPHFALSEPFRQLLQDDCGLSPPSDAFCAMDFHLDWIHACLVLSKGEHDKYPVEETGPLNISQEDVDLLAAYEAEGETHLVMIEAKGVTGWSNAQLEHKAVRLRSIFGELGTENWKGVRPHWVLASPNRPKGVRTDMWPQWMKPGGEALWIELVLPKGLRKIVRCDETGRPSESGQFWKVADG
jgi:hypothetical protein